MCAPGFPYKFGNFEDFGNLASRLADPDPGEYLGGFGSILINLACFYLIN